MIIQIASKTTTTIFAHHYNSNDCHTYMQDQSKFLSISVCSVLGLV
jgi:hypothetical protein